eukprot:9017977-Alexandrium_andersonii.AAC.1
MLQADIFASRDPEPSDFRKALKGVCDHFRKLNTSAVALLWKVKKRKEPSPAAVDMLNTSKQSISDFWTVCLEAAK